MPADVSISGVANASLWVVDSLRVGISGAGHVGYWGQPQVSQRISGFGGVEAAKLEASIKAVAEGYALPRVPGADEVFDPRFLPSAAERNISLPG